MMTETTELTVFEKANRALITHPQFEKVKRMIGIAHRLSKTANEPQCIALEGQTGAGKTTLVQDYASAFPRVETPSGTEIPVFYMETPSPVTVKGMAISMLTKLGDPAAKNGDTAALSSRLAELLIACKVQLVILDDFHHLIDSDTKKVLAKVSDWLKVLIKESKVPFLVVGIEGKVDEILCANEQLSRLFAYREPLKPFEWNEHNPTSMQDFATFIKFAQNSFGITFSKEITRPEMLYRLHYATNGVVANIMNLLRYVALLAGEKGGTPIDLSLMAEAFDTRLAKHLRAKHNPFEKHWGKKFVAPVEKLYDSPSGLSNRIGKRKERVPTSGELLHT